MFAAGPKSGTSSPDKTSDGLAQAARVYGLRNEIDGSCLDSFRGNRSLPAGDANQDVRLMVRQEKLLDDGNTIHVGHLSVQDDEVGLQILILFEQPPATRSLAYYMVAKRNQKVPERNSIAERTVRNQDPLTQLAHLSPGALLTS